MNIDMLDAIKDMLLGMLNAIPKFLSAFTILIFGYIISNSLKKIIQNVLIKLNLDIIGNRLNKISIISNSNLEIKLSKIISKAIYYILMLIFIMASIGALDMPILADLMKDIITYVPNLLVAFIILLGGTLLADTAKNVVLSTCKSIGVPSGNIISHFIFYFLFVNITILALAQAKVNTEFLAQNLSIIVGGGVLAFSIGYGFASKDLVSSFLASFYSKNKINIGDKISIAGYTGIVIELDKSSITIESERKNVIIPLNKLLTDTFEIHKL